MKRCVEFIMGIVLLLAVFVLTGPFSSIWEEEAARTVSGGSEISAYKKELPVIVLDAGHGGRDPGKIGVNGALEKEINLALAQKVKALLEKSGAAEEVILTREDDEGLYDETDSNKKAADLNERCRIIEESGADFVVSIHQNSYTDESVSGPQVFYYKNSEEGKLLAEAVQEELNQVSAGGKTHSARANGNYYMLLHVACPIVIAECGFLSNGAEADKLAEEAYQDQLAEAICRGILAYTESL